jgi:hypothetical protein
MAIAVAKQHLSEVKRLSSAADKSASVLRARQNTVDAALRSLVNYVDTVDASLWQSQFTSNLSAEMLTVMRTLNKEASLAKDATLEVLEIVTLEMRYVEAAREEFMEARKETRNLPAHKLNAALSQIDKGIAAADKYYAVLKEARSRGEGQLNTLELIMEMAERKTPDSINDILNMASSSFTLGLAVFVAATAGPAGLAFIGIAFPVIDFLVDFFFGLPSVAGFLWSKVRD